MSAVVKRYFRGASRPKVFPIGESNGRNIAEIRKRIIIRGGNQFDRSDLDNIIFNIPEATKQGYAVAEEGDSINLSVPNSKTRRGRVGKGEAQTLDTGMQQYTIQSGIRRLTPTECERLQGFPDGWTEKGVDKDGKDVLISDTQRYRILGNAVTVNIVKEIACRLAKHQ